MMKRLTYIISVIALIVSSCTQENLPDNGERENCITLKISNSTMDTKATKEGSEVENTINSLDFYFFPEGGTEQPSTYHKRITYDGGIQKKADVHLYITDCEFSQIFPDNKNNCVAFVVANMPEAYLPEQATSLQALKQIRIEGSFIDSANNPVTPSSFVMQGEKTLTRSSNTANSVTGEVELKRAASKITLRLKLPDYILVPIYDAEGNPSLDDHGNVRKQVWRPEFSAAGPTGGVAYTFASLRNGVSVDYLADEYTLKSTDFFNTENQGAFTYESSTESLAANSSGANIHTYTCDATFYSYSSDWAPGDMHAPCFILQIPWKADGSSGDNYVTHYYQVQINSFGKELAPNHWYDLTLNVGVLGSTVATLPVEIPTCSYQVLDWSTIVTVFDREEEEVHLDEWQYLIFDESQVVLNNKTTGKFYFDSSHKIAWNLEWPKQNEFTGNGYQNLINGFDEIERKYNSSTKYASYYLNCRDVNAAAVCLNSGNLNLINNDCFSVDGRTFNFTVPSRITDQSDTKIYSSVYVHVKVWLDMDEDGQLDENEKKYIYHLTFVYKPALYITPDPSTLRSIYVNGVKHSESHDEVNVTYGNQILGSAAGIRNDNYATTNFSMYVINVSSLSSQDNNKDDIPDDSFRGPTYNNQGNIVTPIGNNLQTYKYIIGDPRERRNELDFDYNDNQETTYGNYRYGGTDWQWRTPARHVDGSTNHRLEYYYPTASDGYSFQVIAPKFRIVSFNNASRSYVTARGAAMRCATLQEDGFPAGRWRLPTIAEVQFIIGLQQQEVIQDIFTSTGSKYATALYTNANKTNLVTLTENGDNLTWDTPQNRISVRCVYDEWYWGSEREAIPNPNDNANTDGDEYLFTWGDQYIY